MYPYDPVILFAQMRQKELLQIADQERLVRAAYKEQSNNRGITSRIIDYLRSRFSEKSLVEQNTHVQDGPAISSASR